MDHRPWERGPSDPARGDLQDALIVEALREAELHYRMVADFTYDWEYWQAPDGTLRYVSPSCARITGYPAERFLDNQNLLDEVVLSQDRQIWDEHHHPVGQPGPREIQFRIRRKDGEVRWIEHRCQPVTDHQGAFLGYRVSNRDITDRKRVEEELQQNRQRLEQLIEERTAELARANSALRAEVQVREQAEQVLREAKEAAEVARQEEAYRRREAERRRQIAEGLGEILTVLNSNRSLDDVLDYIAVQAGRLLGTRAVGIYSLEGESGTLAVQAMQGVLVTYVAGADIPIGQGVLKQAMAMRQAVAVPDVAAALAEDIHLVMDPVHGVPTESWAEDYGALLAVPIVGLNRVYGGMLLYSGEAHAFSDEEIELADAFGDQVALAIENARLREQSELAAATAERDRLARELHDAVTQTLFSANLIAEAMPQVWRHDPEEGERGLAELRQLIRGAAAEMRTMLIELRPAALTEKPLDELLRHLTEAMTGRTRIPIALTVEGSGLLPPDLQIALYRIAQEALNNIAKHAGASRASVDLEFQSQQAALCIQDDGCGFEPEDVLPDCFGLNIMRERAEEIGAALRIDSQSGAGTKVAIDWQGKGR